MFLFQEYENIPKSHQLFNLDSFCVEKELVKPEVTIVIDNHSVF